MRVVRSGRGAWVVVAALLLVAFLATTFGPPRIDADAAQRTPAQPSDAARTELGRDFLALTNDDRAERGLAALRLERRLSRYATRHSREMADRGYIFHSSDAELRRALEGTQWTVAGENVGVGSSLDGLQDAFMASSPHRRNVLARSFDQAAVGVVVDYDRVWITVVFYGD